MELFGKLINDFQSLTIFAKGSILDIQLGSKFVSEGIQTHSTS